MNYKIALTSLLVIGIVALLWLGSFSKNLRNPLMIDHISIPVKNFKAMLSFYDSTLSELGYERLMTFNLPTHNVAGYGAHKKPSFWVGQPLDEPKSKINHPVEGLHIAFIAPSRKAVDAWYDACLKSGGKDNGKPGLRTEYHPGYYAAFIIDPEGLKIEAVHHTFE